MIDNEILKAKKIITLEYARKKLGKKGEKMTDQQIMDLLSTLRLICSKTIDAVIEKRQ